MKIFVTGATGYIGSAIASALARGGHQVTGLSRSEEKDAELRQRGVTPVRGGLGHLGALVRELASQDAVVHAAVDYGLGPPSDAEAVEAMIAAARAAGRPFSLVYTSGVWVLGDTSGVVDERASTDRPFAGVAWRTGHEQRVLAAAGDRIAAAVIRPGMVYGGRRGIIAPWFDQATREGAATCVAPGTQRWSFVHVEDLAQLYRLILERRAQGVFHGVDGRPTPVAEAAEAYGRAAGNGAVRVLPLAEARAAMGGMADALALDQQVVTARAAEVGWTVRHADVVSTAADMYREWKG
jgi:nucleoside-diphosphate-sugar epimerase